MFMKAISLRSLVLYVKLLLPNSLSRKVRKYGLASMYSV